MDDMAAYYPTPPPSALHPTPHHPYYPPPPPHGAQPPPLAPLPHQFHPHHHLHHHQPPFASYAPPHYPQSSHDQVRTLFVAGLPEDVKPREIYNLFHEFPGYESSHLRSPTSSSQPFAFAVFMDQQSAVAAIQALNGMVFDLEKGSTLYVDLAKSNSRSKRSRIDDGKPGSEKRTKGSASFSGGIPDTGVGSGHMPGIGNSAYNTIGYPSTQRTAIQPAMLYGTKCCPIKKQQNSSATACPTIFVANLGPTCMEEELIQVFSSFPGFLKLKMQSTYGAPVAFVDFQDTASSTEALNHLQGTKLYSSPPGEGMRLEYPSKAIVVCEIADGNAQ
ncbi:hypothetical protein RHSIM_Rhsim10G0113800 [Rhododendron simsii]|uniref:RRM domain-containing protein n=1 Tax=Rhododendron simsii TaxID=118357 RepID=A0A834LCT1_RHOSS|nr:hypothetical protein RHSIM_Rhsim10G0113800 [Rhododendron simsii]